MILSRIELHKYSPSQKVIQASILTGGKRMFFHFQLNPIAEIGIPPDLGFFRTFRAQQYGNTKGTRLGETPGDFSAFHGLLSEAKIARCPYTCASRQVS
jgi:hypothetical protein